MALLLWIGGLIGFLARMPQLGVAIWTVNLINGLFSFWQEYMAEKATAALRRLLPTYARVRRDGEEQRILAEELVPGDVLTYRETGDEVIELNVLRSDRRSPCRPEWCLTTDRVDGTAVVITAGRELELGVNSCSPVRQNSPCRCRSRATAMTYRIIAMIKKGKPSTMPTPILQGVKPLHKNSSAHKRPTSAHATATRMSILI
jgi:hypothetical protein